MISISLSGCALGGKKNNIYIEAYRNAFLQVRRLKLGIISLQERGENILTKVMCWSEDLRFIFNRK